MPMLDSSIEELLKKSKDTFGNPSTKYSIGVKAKKSINESRKKIASLLGCDFSNIFFTSGGTEANNILIQSIIRNNPKPVHIVVSAIEHDSVLRIFDNFKEDELIVTMVYPNRNGVIQPNDVEAALSNNTKLIVVQYINNELGTLQPIEEIARIAKEHNVLFHIDAVQAVGHINIDLNHLGNCSLSASAHKFGGPKGVGFLYTTNHSVSLCYGGGQEKGVKSGTENVPSICAMAVALETSCSNLSEKQKHISELVNYLISELQKIKGVKQNVIIDGFHSIISFRIEDVSNEAAINFLDANDIYVSSGSACNGNGFDRSHVLKAIGLNEKEMDETLRISLSFNNTIDECKTFINVLKLAIEKLRRVQ